MTTGTRIKKLRKRNDWTQAELAEKVGCSKQVISNIERGVTRAPADLTAAIANTLRVSADDLVQEDSPVAIYLSAEERQLVLAYRKLVPEDCELLIDMFNLFLSRKNSKE